MVLWCQEGSEVFVSYGFATFLHVISVLSYIVIKYCGEEVASHVAGRLLVYVCFVLSRFLLFFLEGGLRSLISALPGDFSVGFFTPSNMLHCFQKLSMFDYLFWYFDHSVWKRVIHFNTHANITRRLIGYRQNFATENPSICCRKPDVIM